MCGRSSPAAHGSRVSSLPAVLLSSWWGKLGEFLRMISSSARRTRPALQPGLCSRKSRVDCCVSHSEH